MDGGAGEEDDVREAMRGEQTGNMGANHGPGADDEYGACRCHRERDLMGTGESRWLVGCFLVITTVA